MFVCECGKECKTTSGLTNHQKTCEEHQGTKGEETPQMSNNGTTTPTIIKESQRTEIRKRIESRSAAILKAMTSELSNKPEQIAQNLQRNHGLVLGSSELADMIRGIDQQIDVVVSRELNSERQRIEVQQSDIDDEYEDKMNEMNERHGADLIELRDKHKGEKKKIAAEQKEKKQKLKEELQNARERVTKQHARELANKRFEYETKMAQAKQVEIEVEAETRQQVAMLTQSRGHIEHIVKDATNRALEDLICVETVDEAKVLISRVPTVSEALLLCQSPSGLTELFRRLDPNMKALPMPAEKDPETEDESIRAVVAGMEENDPVVDIDDEEEEEEDNFDDENYELEDDDDDNKSRRAWR